MAGDLDTDFGFTGMFWAAEAALDVTRFRAYDPELGRWLSRDPLHDAETTEGPNLYLYVADNPVNAVDRLGLCCEEKTRALEKDMTLAVSLAKDAYDAARVKCDSYFQTLSFAQAYVQCAAAQHTAEARQDERWSLLTEDAIKTLLKCDAAPCTDNAPCPQLNWPLVPTFTGFGHYVNVPPALTHNQGVTLFPAPGLTGKAICGS